MATQDDVRDRLRTGPRVARRRTSLFNGDKHPVSASGLCTAVQPNSAISFANRMPFVATLAERLMII